MDHQIPKKQDIWRGFLVRRATQSRDIRGPGWSGFGECAQEFLRRVDLSTIRVDGLEQTLDRLTDDLLREWAQIVGDQGNTWGIARKTINSFLLDAVHHSRFQDTFEAGLAEKLEMPLDRVVANGLLRTLRPGNHWPRGEGVVFTGVANLDAEQHVAWQELGQNVATTLGLTRVELAVLLADDAEFEMDEGERHDAEPAVALVRES